jgi:hypothetical protein
MYNKPLYIVSCGIQGSIENFENDFKDWKNVLEYARMITVRSRKDKELIESLIREEGKVQYFRDLGYLYPHIGIIKLKKTKEKYITIILAGPINTRNEEIMNYIKGRKETIVIMNMGAVKDDDNVESIKKFKLSGQKVIKYYGHEKNGEFNEEKRTMGLLGSVEFERILREDPELKYNNPGDLTLEKVLNVIYNSTFVFTGRYHGMIFARSLGIPYTTLDMGTNKIMWEDPMEEIPTVVEEAYNHIKLLKNMIG